MHRWSAREVHEVGSDLFEARCDESPRRVEVRQAIVQLDTSGEMGIRRTAPAHV